MLYDIAQYKKNVYRTILINILIKYFILGICKKQTVNDLTNMTKQNSMFRCMIYTLYGINKIKFLFGMCHFTHIR